LGVHVDACVCNLHQPEVADVVASADADRTFEMAFSSISARMAGNGWLWAFFETILGAVLVWMVARYLPKRDPLILGWAGMIGLILLLHFGFFQLLALLWRWLGGRS
jgi:hypothetical protein